MNMSRMLIKLLKTVLVFFLLFSNIYASQKELYPEESMQKNSVVITGVTKGLGRALVSEFAKQGWKIAGCGRSLKMIQELQKEYGPEHIFSVVDVTNNASVATWVHEISEKIGTPTILITNAALINHPNVLWKVQPSEFSKIMETNVIGVFNVLHHFIPLMIEQEKGLIINISSSSGVEGDKEFAPYCTSKFAIEGLTQSLAQELPKGLSVVSLDPGGINTDMLYTAYQESANDYPSPEQRAKLIVPYILNINHKDNGRHLVAPY